MVLNGMNIAINALEVKVCNAFSILCALRNPDLALAHPHLPAYRQSLTHFREVYPERTPSVFEVNQHPRKSSVRYKYKKPILTFAFQPFFNSEKPVLVPRSIFRLAFATQLKKPTPCLNFRKA